MNFGRLILVLALTMSMLTGCASGYRQFYQASPSATPEAIARDRVAPPTGYPIVEHGPMVTEQNVNEIYGAYAKRGFGAIGRSFFNSGMAENDEAAIEQARTVGADLVMICSPTHAGSVTSSVPISTPTTSTTYSTASGTAYGAGGATTLYGSGTSTTYGTQTAWVPVTVNRTQYGAIYFVKRKSTLGLIFRDLNDTERTQLQSNRGASVLQVVDDSPAYFADFLKGDIVTEIDGVAVNRKDDIRRILDAKKDRQISISFIRAGRKLEKTLQLNQ